MKALAIAATGMNAQQTNLEVIANNIANINTTGYKRARAEFSDLLYQVDRTQGVPNRSNTSLVPEGVSIGLGVKTTAVRNVHTQGELTSTGNSFDMALTGRGWFQIEGADGGTLYSRAGKTGTLRWDAGVSGTEVLPAVAGSTVFTAAPCLVIALDAKTGDRRWTYDTGCSGGGGGMPIYFEGRIYVNDGMESVVLDAAKGKKLRNFPKYYYPPAFWTNPSGNSPGFLLDGTGRLHAFDTVTGRNLWNSKRHRFDTPPLVISDTVVIGSGFRLYGLDTRTGAILWSQDTGTFIEASFPNGPIGLGAGDGKVFIPNDTAVSAWGSPRQ